MQIPRGRKSRLPRRSLPSAERRSPVHTHVWAGHSAWAGEANALVAWCNGPLSLRRFQKKRPRSTLASCASTHLSVSENEPILLANLFHHRQSREFRRGCSQHLGLQRGMGEAKLRRFRVRQQYLVVFKTAITRRSHRTLIAPCAIASGGLTLEQLTNNESLRPAIEVAIFRRIAAIALAG
jgi:hypothetical protein